jgi:hypothetical protein
VRVLGSPERVRFHPLREGVILADEFAGLKCGFGNGEYPETTLLAEVFCDRTSGPDHPARVRFVQAGGRYADRDFARVLHAHTS